MADRKNERNGYCKGSVGLRGLKKKHRGAKCITVARVTGLVFNSLQHCIINYYNFKVYLSFYLS